MCAAAHPHKNEKPRERRAVEKSQAAASRLEELQSGRDGCLRNDRPGTSAPLTGSRAMRRPPRRGRWTGRTAVGGRAAAPGIARTAADREVGRPLDMRIERRGLHEPVVDESGQDPTPRGDGAGCQGWRGGRKKGARRRAGNQGDPAGRDLGGPRRTARPRRRLRRRTWPRPGRVPPLRRRRAVRRGRLPPRRHSRRAPVRGADGRAPEKSDRKSSSSSALTALEGVPVRARTAGRRARPLVYHGTILIRGR